MKEKKVFPVLCQTDFPEKGRKVRLVRVGTAFYFPDSKVLHIFPNSGTAIHGKMIIFLGREYGHKFTPKENEEIIDFQPDKEPPF